MDETAAATPPPAASRRAFAILTGVATLFVFFQFLTAGDFVRSHGAAAETWTNVHGVTAYGVLVPSLGAAVVALIFYRRSARVLCIIAVGFFIAAVAQWGTGHLISTLHMDGWTPFHVFFSSVVLALAVWSSVRSALLTR